MTSRGTERATQLRADGARWDATLGALRREGFSKVDAIRATVEVLRLPMGDAKRLVHESMVWRDVRNDDDRLLDSLVEEAEGSAAAQRS